MMGVVKLLVASIHELASCDASSQLTVLDGIWLKRPGSVIAVPLEIRRSIFLTNIKCIKFTSFSVSTVDDLRSNHKEAYAEDR